MKHRNRGGYMPVFLWATSCRAQLGAVDMGSAKHVDVWLGFDEPIV